MGQLSLARDVFKVTSSSSRACSRTDGRNTHWNPKNRALAQVPISQPHSNSSLPVNILAPEPSSKDFAMVSTQGERGFGKCKPERTSSLAFPGSPPPQPQDGNCWNPSDSRQPEVILLHMEVATTAFFLSSSLRPSQWPGSSVGAGTKLDVVV